MKDFENEKIGLENLSSINLINFIHVKKITLFKKKIIPNLL